MFLPLTTQPSPTCWPGNTLNCQLPGLLGGDNPQCLRMEEMNNRWTKRVSNCYFNPLQVCYLYVEGSGAGDHFKQVVPHHQLTAEHRTETKAAALFNDHAMWRPESSPDSSTYSPANKKAHWPLFALLNFVNLLQRDDSQRLPLLQGRRTTHTVLYS